MDAILENDVSFNGFKTYFETLNVLKQKEFVRRNFDVIKDLRDADKLDYLCNHGFFNALVPLTKCGNKQQIYNAFINYYGGIVFAYIAPSHDDEVNLIKFASDKLDIIMYLRENTFLFDRRLGRKGHLVTHLCEYASKEVIDYLFNWVVNKKVFLFQVDAKIMFARAEYKTIIDYIDYVRGLSGDRDYVSYSMIVGMHNRQDLTANEKNHIMLFALSKMKVCSQTVSQLRKNGFLE